MGSGRVRQALTARGEALQRTIVLGTFVVNPTGSAAAS
jgi:hypothetical protein